MNSAQDFDDREDRRTDYESWEDEAYSRKEDHESSKLERRSLLGDNEKKRKFGFFALLLLLLLLGLFLIFKNSNKAPPEGIIQEAEEFEPVPKRRVSIPQAPAIPEIEKPPTEVDLKKVQEQEALRQARLKSAILVYQGSATPSKVKLEKSNGSEAGQASLSTEQTLSQDPNRQFEQASQLEVFPKARASALGSLSHIVLQGKLIDAVLETGINSDLPGMIRAIVSHDIYGESGKQVLIPRGSRLIGQYNSSIRKGQARVFVIWNRLIRPDGIQIALNSGGADSLGVAGLKGRVNNHFFKIFGTSALLSILGAGSATVGVGTLDQNNSLAMYRQELANSFQETSAGVLEQHADIPPTITVKPGSLIKVFVARDLDFREALNTNNLGSQPLFLQ